MISCVDVCQAGYLYNEYFNGMMTFVDLFLNEISDKNTNVSALKQQLQTALNADPLFVESLFGGKNNAPVEEELTDAIRHVEYLVDFFDMLKMIRKNVAIVCHRAEKLYNDTNCDDIRGIVSLVSNSACEFSNRIIYAILAIYDRINNSLNTGATSGIARNESFKVF